jgi:type IV secretion system protein VirB10
VTHDPPKDAPSSTPSRGEYLLAPGTTIPLILESEVNSDVPGPFTARVSQGVYDSATHRHLLIPQGATIVGHDQSQALLYGNERLPTLALTLSLPDGRSVELGQAPITDQTGVVGLTGDVHNHYGRLLGAVLIGGALKGGMQAMQTAIAAQGSETQVAVGISQSGTQVVSSRLGRALDTRPTILLHAGQLGTVLLLKPLTLSAFYE